MSLKEKYINPFTDFGFKKLFGEEPNKDLLIDFLNQILPQHHQITELTYTSTEKLGISEIDRKAIFDLYCTSKSGEKFIVEMQKAKQNYFKDRSVFYSTFPIQEQAPKGVWDFKLAAVYLVGILDFVFDEDKKEQEVLHEIKLKNQHGEVFYDKLTLIYLEMPNFNKTEEEIETNFDKWLYVLKNLPYLETKPKKLQEKVFQKLFKTAEIAKFNREEVLQYEQSLKVYRDLKNVIDTAFDDGKAEGLAEGRNEEKLERITLMLKKGKLSVEEIADIFEVTTQFVAEIKAELNL
jgi:predicted transposase/invertase (TIGR01784 family)